MASTVEQHTTTIGKATKLSLPPKKKTSLNKKLPKAIACQGHDCGKVLRDKTSKFNKTGEDVAVYCPLCPKFEPFCDDCVYMMNVGEFCAGLCGSFFCYQCKSHRDWLGTSGYDDRFCSRPCTRINCGAEEKCRNHRLSYKEAFHKERLVGTRAERGRCEGVDDDRYGNWFRCDRTTKDEQRDTLSLKEGDVFCVRHGGRLPEGYDSEDNW